MKNIAWCGAWVCWSLLAGCGGDDGAAVPDAGPDASGCHELAQSASEVVQQRVAAVAPAATGGTIPDGTYHLIEDTIYTGIGGATGPSGYESTLTSSCVALDCRVTIEETGGTVPLQSFDLTIDDTTLTFTQTCPDTGEVDTTFTGDGATVKIYEVILTGTRERIYELQ